MAPNGQGKALAWAPSDSKYRLQSYAFLLGRTNLPVVFLFSSRLFCCFCCNCQGICYVEIPFSAPLKWGLQRFFLSGVRFPSS